MTEEHVFGIESIKFDYENNLITSNQVKELIGILRSEGILGDEVICEINGKKYNEEKQSWIHFMDVLDPSNKLTYIKNPLNEEKLTVVFHSQDSGFNRGDIVVGEYYPETSLQYLDKLIKVKSETVRKLPKSQEIKDLYGNKFAKYLEEKFESDKELIPIIYEKFEEIYTEKAEDTLQYIEELKDKQNEIILETKEKESKCKSLDKSIDIRERKIKVLDEDIHQLKEKINKLKKYFIYELELDHSLDNDSKELIKVDNIEEIILTIQKLLYHYEDEGLVYSYDVISSFFKALKVDQLVLLSGPSGTGKSSLVNQLGKIINKFKVHHIAVQSSWSDVQDILGFFNPIQKRYVSTPFLDALVEAKLDPNGVHIICLDEMNLAHIEYYFSSFLSIREKNINERCLDLYSYRTFKEAKRELEESLGENIEDLIEQGIDKIEEKINTLKKVERDIARNNFELVIYYPAKFIIPKNVRFVGTLNMDETVKSLSPKVIDRSFIIELKHLENYDEIRKSLEDDYIDGIIDIDTEEFIQGITEDIVISAEAKSLADEIIEQSKILNIIPNVRLNGRGRKHIEQFINTHIYDKDLIYDQIIYSKILPRIHFNKLDEEKLSAFNSFINSLPNGYSKEKATNMLRNKRIIQFWG
ncbi:GTPase subunit of restriction endonuclease [Romboutsia ilealis]|uniref:GTPase subunit of restriction endonuclease n=1 Tax=Romboutsia ilealis TaxID=1115758 RepID=A0A1V1I1M7_9FIRM|nr:AAA family ATPase [Romboutsia ilealis]CED94053.1 GTPase subunit of restriction endonuclease [Romboutsia ilealis]